MRNWLSEQLNISLDHVDQILATVITVIVIVVARWLLVRIASKRVDDTEALFRIRKAVVYGATFVLIVALARIWSGAFGNLGTFLGLVSAGVAIALGDVFLNFAGWVYILTRQPFRAGDRIEIGSSAGDVVDIRILRFTLLEIGNWVDGDQPTGRLLHIPNGLLFRQSMANYTESFDQIWHEIGVMVTFESDWKLAEQLILESLKSRYLGDEEVRAKVKFQEASRKYFIRTTDFTPTVFTDVKESGVMLTARLLVDPRKRRQLNNDVWRDLLEAFAKEPSVELAYPTIRTFRGPEFGSG